ncbi:MAG: hypothetical protein ABGW75_10430, partial [Pirellulales bacterium]
PQVGSHWGSEPSRKYATGSCVADVVGGDMVRRFINGLIASVQPLENDEEITRKTVWEHARGIG